MYFHTTEAEKACNALIVIKTDEEKCILHLLDMNASCSFGRCDLSNILQVSYEQMNIILKSHSFNAADIQIYIRNKTRLAMTNLVRNFHLSLYSISEYGRWLLSMIVFLSVST